MKEKASEGYKETIISCIQEEDLADKPAILINNVEEGFENYEYLVLQGEKEAFEQFLTQVMVLNGTADSYADFYYARLDENEKEYFHKALSKENRSFLLKGTWSEGIYYSLDSRLLQFLLEITANELLFCTFYFTRYACTVWGNYGLQFPVFFRDGETKERYQKLAEACGLTTE
jgi:hypothetical protein